MSTPVVLTFIDHYLPGCKFGGPMRTVDNMVEQLSGEFSFRIVTRDRDLGDTQPYPACPVDSWTPVGKALVRYLPPRRWTPGAFYRIINQTEHEAIYLNSLFSPIFTLWPLILRRFGLIRRRPVVLAPRGELLPGALRVRWFKKVAFLAVARAIGLYRGILWHASSEEEAACIRGWFGRQARIWIAPNICSQPVENGDPVEDRSKQPGVVRIAFLSRISRNKNLAGALRIIGQLRGSVEFHIFGPQEDAGYWSECQSLIEKLPANVSVTVHGPVPHHEVVKALRQCHVFLLPTHGENFGHTILEAFLAGCLVVISDRTPWRGLEEEGVGWTLPLEHPEEFRAVLQRCVAMDDAEYQAGSARAVNYGRLTSNNPKRMDDNRLLFRNAGIATGASNTRVMEEPRGDSVRKVKELPRPKVLVLNDYYLPGCKGGGVIRTLNNMVERLGDRLDFQIITRDRDLGDTEPYAACQSGRWQRLGQARVIYLSPGRRAWRSLCHLINQTPHGVLYLNSFFSPLFTIVPLVLRRLGLINRCPVVLAPRGELSPAVLCRGRIKKHAYLLASRTAGLYRDVIWQAASAWEEKDIRRWFGKARVYIAPDVHAAPSGADECVPERVKQAGSLKVAFLARISRTKNLHGALQMLSRLEGRVQLHLYGPIEDRGYWDECQRIIRAMPSNVSVHWYGPIPFHQVLENLRHCHMLLLPTFSESFGHVILESLLAGCPVIISDRTPWRGLEERGIGWDLPLENPERFHGVLRRCVEMEDGEFQRMSHRARQYGRSVADDNGILEENVRIFENAMRDKRLAA